MMDILKEYTVLHHPTQRKCKVQIIADDDFGPPEQEHEGHGVVMGFDYDPTDVDALIEREGWDDDEQCSAQAMEEVARAKMFLLVSTRDSRYGRYNKWYDVWETLKIAAAQWGVPADDKDALMKAVISDYEYVSGWYNYDWGWAYLQVTLLDSDGEEFTGHTASVGGLEWGLDGSEEHIAQEVNGLVREVVHGYNSVLTNTDPTQLELIPLWEGLQGEVTRV
jgi:hypothetical protein